MSGAFDRAEALARLGDERFDVLVIGGGITGAGVALDAASRGLRTALVDRGDFASGTSSKSSKLVHGGLRYLHQREYRLVYEALAERERLRRLAPHLVQPMPFLLPIFSRDGLVNPKVARALGTAMWLYDLTGGARCGKLHRRLDRAGALAHMPTLPADRLASAYLYHDARADDCRLVLSVLKTAAGFGAAVANHAPVVALTARAGRVNGAEVAADGGTVTVRAGVVVNATGVWADDVRRLDDASGAPGPGTPGSIRPAKGIHVVVPWAKVRNDVAVVVPVPRDRRSLFCVPWGPWAYVGTTDTDYDGPRDDPCADEADVAYVLDALNASLTTPVGTDDVVGAWAGLRPLVVGAGDARTADLSRRHQVSTSASGLVTVTGGKLTTYRRMAADTVDAASAVLDRRTRCRTAHVHLDGAEGYQEPDAGAEPLHRHLAHRYGGHAPGVLGLAAADPTLAEPLVAGLPYLRAEAVHAVRAEMARTLDDVLSRRTRARLLHGPATAAAAAEVAALVGGELGWSRQRADAEVAAFRASVAAEREAAGLPGVVADAALPEGFAAAGVPW